MTQCSMESSFLFGPPERCTNDAVVVLVIGCKREHINESPACEDCARVMRRDIEHAHCGACCPNDHAFGGCSEGERVVIVEERAMEVLA